MKKKRLLFIIISILAIIGLIIVFIANSSYAYEYKNENYTLYYSNDFNELKNNIQEYIAIIDDYLIPNSSYIYSDVLTENYDFLVNFAIDYMINKKEIYNDKIVKLDNYKYKNKYLEDKITNEYIKIQEIYEITDNFFGLRDFVIINDNINIIDDYISLSRYVDTSFDLKINNLSISVNDDTIDAYVYYETGDIIKYQFKVINKVLKLYNIEV